MALQQHLQSRPLCASRPPARVRGPHPRLAASRSEGAALHASQTWLQRQRVLHTEPHPSDADIIELNCGGSVMVTSRCTLRQVKGSLLCLLFDPANHHLLRHDTQGRVFLDHDPAAFGLLLRHLREVRAAAGYGCTPVVLPAIPPADAPSFRALNTHLGLGIPEEDIAAAVRKGAALATATTAPTHTYLAAGHPRPTSSPYASRPVPPCTAQQQQQQQWLRQQWQQQCSPGAVQSHTQQQQQQQQQQQTGTAAFDGTQSIASSAAVGSLDAALQAAVQREPARSTEQSAERVTAADWDALTYPVPAAATAPPPQQLLLYQQLLAHANGGRAEQQQAVQPTGGLGDSHTAIEPPARASDVAAAGGAAAAEVEYSTPAVQDFYMLTSPAGTTTTTSSSSSGGLLNPLRVSVLTEGDMLALQQAQQQQQQRGGGGLAASGSLGVGFAGEGAADAGPLDFDVFCSTSNSRGLMGLSLVVREGAGLDNVFVGLTTTNQADQRGLQIPSFGWHQVTQCPADVAAATTTAELDTENAQQQQQQRWATGDLVQLVLERGSNKLRLSVNNQPGTGAGSLASNNDSSNNDSSSSSSVSLPAFQDWCWYLALYRGTQVVAVVLDQTCYSVYSGDTQLKRYMC